METLVVVANHRDQYYSRGKSHSSAQFGSSPSRGFREINCRLFEYGAALLPTPLKFSSTPLSNASPSSPSLKSGDGKPSKRNVKSSSPISISFKGGKKESPQNHETPFSELWAGPAYSNSPPPSSLPMPKFQMKPKRTVSLELPPTVSEISPYPLIPIAKSAPASPTRELKHSAITFLHDDDTATKTLRRMLNLDLADD